MKRREGDSMIANPINDDKTIAGGGEGAILAGWYRILRRLELGGMGGASFEMV